MVLSSFAELNTRLLQALDAEDGSFTIAGARPSAPPAADVADDSGLPDSGMFALFSD